MKGFSFKAAAKESGGPVEHIRARGKKRDDAECVERYDRNKRRRQINPWLTLKNITLVLLAR